MLDVLSATTIVDWLDASAARYPNRAAVEDTRGQVLRYAQAAEISRGVCGTLLALGVTPGSRVAVVMTKSADTLLTFQAVLRSGAAYVPIDARAPMGRAAAMIEDCHAAAVFVDEELLEPLASSLRERGVQVPVLAVPRHAGVGHQWRIESLARRQSARHVAARPADLAFLLYTSGSTGKPKAVMLTHENVVAFVDWCSAAFAPTADDKFGTHGALHFSLPVFNLYVAWKHGATVVLIDEQTARMPALLAPIIDRQGVTIWFSTPTILSLLAQSGELASTACRSLRLVMFGGESFPLPALRHLRQQWRHPRYVHILGSTETHMMASYEVPADLDAVGRTLPIGHVCGHFRSRVLDEAGDDAAPGIDGELCLSGAAVTPGYWNSPSDMARAFFTSRDGIRWYRTGDIVRREFDGTLVYRGRRDRMVKKRGHRVELAEIEACLYENSAVQEAAVVAIDDQAAGLQVKAFVVPRAGTRPTIIDLKAHCARTLPPYMVPDAFAFRRALPRTSNGKVDFPALKAAG